MGIELTEIFNILAQGKGLQHLVDAGYEMLGNPLCVIDNGMRTIAVNTNARLMDGDHVWNEILLNGYTSMKSIAYYKKQKLTESVSASDSPIFWKDEYCRYPRIIQKITVGSRQIATVYICEHEKPFEESDYQALSVLSQAISIEMQKNDFNQFSRGLYYENLIEDILSGSVYDKSIIDYRLKALNMSFKKSLFILSIVSEDEDYNKLPYMRDEAEKLIPSSKAVIHDRNIVILISTDRKESELKNSMDSLNMFLKNHNLAAGLSWSFTRLEEAREYYHQSLDALKLGKLLDTDSLIFRFQDLAVFHIADICSGQADLKKLCHPSLQLLMDYDKKNGTDYVRTLHTYIIHSGNLAESAIALHVHRNTIIYRMDKIQEILNVRLNDSNILLHLHLSFKFMEYMKLFMP